MGFSKQEKLVYYLKRTRMSYGDLARILDISSASAGNRLTCATEFKVSEINTIINHLGHKHRDNIINILFGT